MITSGILVASLLGFAATGAAAAAPPEVERLSGADRYATSVEVAKEYDPGVPVVYIASGKSFADALSAAPAAAAAGGPLLLTLPYSLPAAVRSEIQRLSPASIVVVGGTGAVSQPVFDALASLAPSIRRDAGPDRYSTSRVVTQRAFGAASRAFLATGANFPDALSASAAAGAMGAPVVLVRGVALGLDSDTFSLLDDLGVSGVYIAGGDGAVSAGIEGALQRSGRAVERVAGIDRYATSTAINARFFDTADTAFFAVGTGFADALSGAALAGARSAPLFVTPASCVPTGALTQLAQWGTATHVLLGGVAVLGPGVQNAVPCADGNTFEGSGDHFVGEDIQPGVYFSQSTSSCYWERLTRFNGDMDSVIDNDFGTGQRIVSIEPRDVGFSSSRCGRWYPIAGAPRLATIPSEGVFWVSHQIEPGTFRAPNPTGSCYWARRADFSRDLDSIIANDFVEAGEVIVTLEPGDTTFESSRCGVWTRVG